MKNQEKLCKTNKIICGDNLEELAKFAIANFFYPRDFIRNHEGVVKE